MTKKNILITGGSGLVGQLLTKELLQLGHKVSHLSRHAGKKGDVKIWMWDVDKGQIDENCLDGVDTIVHLAGAGVAEKRWTDQRKKEITDSRVKSIELIYTLMKKKPNKVKSVISASATGYYGDRADEELTEGSDPGNDFLSRCCIDWENAVAAGEELGLRVLKFRTGVVLNKAGGALPQLALPVKFYVGSPIGDGKQWIPWIHWKDVISLYVYGIENEQLSGVYNMTAPIPVTNEQMSRAIAKELRKPFWAPNVPAFVLKLLLGEMSIVVLGSTKPVADEIISQGYTFKFPGITDALNEIYNSE